MEFGEIISTSSTEPPEDLSVVIGSQVAFCHLVCTRFMPNCMAYDLAPVLPYNQVGGVTLDMAPLVVAKVVEAGLHWSASPVVGVEVGESPVVCPEFLQVVSNDELQD